MFIRQTAFIGPEAQEKLACARVAIVGVGGTGTAAAQLLARMGIGTIILVDADKVEEHNLARQLLYTKKDIGAPKVDAAKTTLQSINSQLTIQTIPKRFPCELPDVDIILDCVDAHDARRAIDKYAKEKNLTWIHGAAIEDKGALCVFDNKLSYDDVYSKDATDQHCEITGVLATSTATIGTLQAQLVVSYLLGNKLPKGLLHVNLSNFSFDRIEL